MSDPVNVLIVGVGGQGVILVSKVLATLAQSRGLDVKQSEVHGMAKRGGTVFSHVRFGPQVWSPTIPQGEADLLVALEWAEGLRWLPYLKPQSGIFLCDTKRIVPPFACLNRRPGATMRYSRETPAQMREHVAEGYAIDATRMAEALGNERTANVVLLGAVSSSLDFSQAEWRAAIAQFVPERTLSINLEAFRLGREWIERTRRDGPASLDEEAAARSAASDVPAAAAAAAYAGAAAAALNAAALNAGTLDAGALDAGAYVPRLEITPAWCKSCDICVKLCPERCLRLNDERIVELTDPARCTGCRLCEWLCPDFAIRVHLDPAAAGAPA